MEVAHIPVLLEEVLSLLAPPEGKGLVVDATLGEAGHSEAFLSLFHELRLIGVDVDPAIQAVARERLSKFGDRVEFYTGWAQDFFAEYPAAQFKRPDIILIDLGISMWHYEKSGRGFSFRKDEPLDMKLDSSSSVSASELVARLPEKELADLLYNNANERYSRRIARAIVEQRQRSPIASTVALADLVERAVPDSYRHGPIHPATKTFQALRIAANGELARLSGLLEGALRVLEPGGRLGVITFHSQEDRIVKNFFREQNKDCICPPESPICKCSGRRAVNILTRKGISPTETEIQRNPPSRSARLRVVEKVLDEDVQ
jgi:16S rRNA (cytosine1402-N4)-methyltransferase